LEQIQFLLGHRSVETTERYLGSRQRLVSAVNDKIGLEPDYGGTIRRSCRKPDFTGSSTAPRSVIPHPIGPSRAKITMVRVKD